jgi:nicotinamide-nucleotide amidase
MTDHTEEARVGDAPADLAQAISHAADRDGRRIAIIESLTGGLLCSDLAASSGSSVWFRGGVVAYDRATKHGMLRVPDGPVVAEPAVRTMVSRAAELFEADLVLAISGAGGPEPQDDQPPGTVWFAIHDRGQVHAWYRRFPGDPREILNHTRSEALHVLRDQLGRARHPSLPTGVDPDPAGTAP